MNNKGSFRIMAASPETFPGDVKRCYEGIKTVIDAAVAQGVSLLLLPEMCLTSSSCGDLFRNESIVAAAEYNVQRLCEYTKDKEIICCISFPLLKGENLYSVAALVSEGHLLGIVPLPPNKNIATDVFSEYQGENTSVHFAGQVVPFGNSIRFSIGKYRDLSICIGRSPEKHTGASVYLVPDALPAGIGRQTRIEEWCSKASEKNRNVVVYCSSGEGETTSFGVFSEQTVITVDGEIVAESSIFLKGSSVADVELDLVSSNKPDNIETDPEMGKGSETVMYPGTEYDPPVNDSNTLPFLGEDDDLSIRCKEAFEIQSRGLAGRLKKTGICKAVLGVSGGLDSTLALLVAVRAMEILDRDRTQVIAVSMPCFGTSVRTKTNAQTLCEEMGVDFRVIDISDSVRQHLSDIGHDTVTADAAYENAQARERTQILMDLSNMENGLVVGTGDMSEAALGWCTFNGDHMSMYNVNCSVTKTFIRAIVAYYADNTDNPIIGKVLRDIVDTPVSPELKPAKDGEITQKTEDIIGPYDVHDFFLYHFIRDNCSPRKLLNLAVDAFDGIYTKEQIYIWGRIFFRRFILNQFKRSCSPDGPIVGSINLSYNGWKIPSDYSVADLLSEY